MRFIILGGCRSLHGPVIQHINSNNARRFKGKAFFVCVRLSTLQLCKGALLVPTRTDQHFKITKSNVDSASTATSA
eukprot:6192596-Pleurochrysis_carterae.AAC.3